MGKIFAELPDTGELSLPLLGNSDPLPPSLMPQVTALMMAADSPRGSGHCQLLVLRANLV